LKLNFDYGGSDNNGNVKSQTINTGTTTFTQTYQYDSLNRLTEAKELSNGNQTWKQNFDYDRYGNRTTISEYTGNNLTNNQTPQIDSTNNRFTTATGFVYDLSGNVIFDNLGRTFNYDAENKQKQVTNGSITLGVYFFDGEGKRVKKVSTTEHTIFVYDATGKTVAEYSVELSQTPQISYLTTDNLGSVRIITNQIGQVINRRDFQPFGEEIARYGQDKINDKFATYKRDEETNLDFAQARMFEDNYGRFTSPDPTMLSVNGNNPQSWNRYIYVMNSPLSYSDPLGLWRIETSVYWKMNEDGTYATDDKGRRIVDHVTVWAYATKDGDDGASLAKQLGLTGDEAKAFAETVGDAGSLALSNLNSYGSSKIVKEVSEFFSFIEQKLQKQVQWEENNPEKVAKADKKNKSIGPSDNDCSGTTCNLGLRENIIKVGTNVLDTKLFGSRNENELRLRDIVRYADGSNTAKHFANFIFRNDDGSIEVFSKSGADGPYQIRPAKSLENADYGKIKGIRSSSGYYPARSW
jgi:RHS repeat-associated protein